MEKTANIFVLSRENAMRKINTPSWNLKGKLKTLELKTH